LRITGSRAAPGIAEIGLFERPGGAGTVTSVRSGKCVDVNGASTANGATVQLWDCNARSNQQWSRTSSRQLTVYGAGTANGTRLVIWTCNGGTNQKWQLH
jgi:hypothetical protein